ncbi:MAG: T9SS type A sorting domain-containing protein [Paludibacter sp.]|nr:T9SS type A sorting domain-containing protein [Paludibacter sp.]
MKKSYMIVCLSMMLGISVQTMAQTDPGTANLTHKWTFEDGTANDGVGTLNGTLMDGATVSGGALNTTAGGYVSIDPTALNVKSYTELTVEAWFTPSAGVNTSYHFLYYFGYSDGNGNHFTGVTPARGNNVSRAMIDTGSGEQGVNNAEFDDGLLHHLVCVIDATTLSYYMDGVLVNTTSIGSASLANINNGAGSAIAYFAKGGWGGDPTWRGTINEISVYNKALTADNVKYLYNLHKIDVPATNPGTANLTHKWSFDENANDLVGTANGTLTDGATIANKALNTTTGGYVNFTPSDLAVNTYTELTVESWFTPVAGGNNGYHFLYYFGKSDGNGNHFTGFTPSRDGNPAQCGRFMIATGNGEDGQQGINTTKFTDGRLHHSVCVIDGTSVTAYIDGNLLGTTSIGANTLANVFLPAGPGSNYAYFCKGGWNDPTWKGQIHEISMYNKALTANNVKYLFNLGPEPVTDGVTAVDMAKKMNHHVYVSNNQIVAQFESANAASSKIEIYSVQGSLLSSEMFTSNAGLNTKTIKADYPAGIYLVRLAVGGETVYTKIIK